MNGDPVGAEQADTDPSAEAVREDLNRLIATGLGMAQEQLEAQGAFLPAALVMTHGNEIRMIAVSPEDDGEDLDADQMIADLYQVLAGQRGENRAAAVVSDIHLPEDGTDAVHVVTEHSAGVAVAAIQPYAEASGEWSYGELIWEPCERTVWPEEGHGHHAGQEPG